MATLSGKQAKKLIGIFENTPTEQVQAVIESGFLADLRDGNIDAVSRDNFRKLLGLVPNPRNPVASIFTNDKTKEGWTLFKNVSRRITSVRDLELVSFLKKGEYRVKGATVERRAAELNADLGQEDAEYLLEHQDEIPIEFQKYRLIFPGTVWERWDSSGGNALPYIRGGGWWGLGFGWPTDDFDSNARLLRPRSK